MSSEGARVAAWRISGRVQGVGFRYFTRREATRLGVRGWVRNEPDGTVSVVASGSPDEVAALAERLRQGPPGAVVAELVETEPPTDPGWDDFRVVFR